MTVASRPTIVQSATIAYLWELISTALIEAQVCRAASVLLALSWGHEVWLYDVPIPSAGPADGAAGSPVAPARLECAEVGQWGEASAVLALHWLDGPALAVLCEAAAGVLIRLYDPGSPRD